MGAPTFVNDLRSLSRQPPPDPDIQATLSDFLTYTDHFPSQLTRALCLIEDQRRRAERKIRSIHDDAVTWSTLPTLRANTKDTKLTAPVPAPETLRRNISHALEEAERASRMAVEEAIRLEETCGREAKRLGLMVEKLKAQPMPPSRDPTPEQQALTSPNLRRERRFSVRDDTKPEKSGRRMEDRAATKLRGRKIMVPGEVLPPPDPDAPPDSVSDWTSPRRSPPVEEWPFAEQDRKPPTPRHRSRTPRPDRERKQPKLRLSRGPGQPGTNAHSSVAGISTSNALLALTAPPEDAVKGSKWLPWMALTEWEMAKLRKRMKKNAIWVPSQTMVRRELKNLGRGVAGKEAARKEAEETGSIFLDEQNAIDPTKTVLSGEEPAHATVVLDEKLYEGGAADDEDQELINRGMRLNEAKKLKRQRLLEEQALQAQIAREQGIEPNTGDSKPALGQLDVKKRKRESSPTLGQSSGAGGAHEAAELSNKPTLKKIRIASGSSTSKVPLGPPGVSSSPRTIAMRSRRTATPPATHRKPTLVLKTNKAVSEEPPNRRATLRRASNASLPNGSSLPSPVRGSNNSTSHNNNKQSISSNSRRNRRPAPGILTTADADSAKVGVSKRKAAPRKKGGAASSNNNNNNSTRSTSTDQLTADVVQDEDIDPNEPRYCVCGDVSWGTMIACDNEDNCENQWFHLSCVGLDGMPPRRTKWYCPDCRKKLKLGIGSNGLVGRTTTVGGR